MDYGLVPQSDACKRLVTLVLILVVMEDGLIPLGETIRLTGEVS